MSVWIETSLITGSVGGASQPTCNLVNFFPTSSEPYKDGLALASTENKKMV